MSERFLLGDRKRINEENIKIFFESGFQKNIRPNFEFSAMRGELSAVMLIQPNSASTPPATLEEIPKRVRNDGLCKNLKLNLSV